MIDTKNSFSEMDHFGANSKTNKILIAIDYQKGFRLDEGGQNNTNLETLIENKDSKFDVVIQTKFISYPRDMFVQMMNWTISETDGKLVKDGGLVYDKSLYSCVDKEFLNRLRSYNEGQYPREVYLCGYDTNACVLKTALDLFEMGIKPIVIGDACYSSVGREGHEAGLVCLRADLGDQNVISINDL